MRRNRGNSRSKLLAGASVAALITAILGAGHSPAVSQAASYVRLARRTVIVKWPHGQNRIQCDCGQLV